MAAASPVVEKVIRTRTLPSEPREWPEFWGFLEGLTEEDWNSNRYVLFILREDPKPSTYGGQNTVEKCMGYIDVRPGERVLLNSREDVELAIRQKYGGRAFRLILKDNGQRITEGKCINEHPPKYPDPIPSQFGQVVNPAPTPTTDVAMKAMETVAGKDAAGIDIATRTLQSAASMIANLAEAQMKQHAPPAPVAPPTDPFRERILDILLTRALEKPPDPIDTFIKLKEIMGGNGSSSANNPLVDKLLNAAVERMLNPVPMSGEKTNIGVELVRALPAMISQGRDAVESWSVGMQAQERTAAIMSGRAPNPPATQPASSPPQRAETQPPSQPSAAPPAAPGVEPSVMPSAIGEPPIDWLEVKILEILMEPSYSVDEAVDETLSFLYRAAPSMPGRLLAAGEEGLTHLFRTRPILAHVPMNARLVEFIKKFVIETEAAEAARKPAPKVETIRNVPPAEPPPASA